MKFSRRDLLKKSALASAAMAIPGASSTAFSMLPVKRRNTDDIVKLNSNENPYGPSASARQAVMNSLDAGNRYPRNIIKKLKSTIAAREGLKPANILITAGSTELLGLAGLAYGLKGGNLISSQPTFDFLLEYSTRIGAEWKKIPLTKSHGYNLEGIKSAMNSDTKLIFICNPNNPTGIEIPHQELKSFVKDIAPTTPVYLDEAYIELSSMGTDGSFASFVNEYPNLIIARTFSKVYGLAGLRIGYAIAHAQTIEKLSNFHTGRMITPSVASVAAAHASLEDRAFFERCIDLNGQAREKVYAKFNEWGIESLPSATSFIFFRTDKFEVDIRKELEKRNVFIRNYSHVPGWARVSMGTLDEMDVFLEETKSLMAT